MRKCNILRNILQQLQFNFFFKTQEIRTNFIHVQINVTFEEDLSTIYDSLDLNFKKKTVTEYNNHFRNSYRSCYYALKDVSDNTNNYIRVCFSASHGARPVT
jgi:hypothetical protein